MSRGTGRKGLAGTPMVPIGKKRKPKWMLKSYEDRVAARNAASARRLERLEAKGTIESHGTAVKEHCGSPTVLSERYADLTTKRNVYGSFCTVCGAFPTA